MKTQTVVTWLAVFFALYFSIANIGAKFEIIRLTKQLEACRK